MADKEVKLERDDITKARRLVEVWASIMDSLLQRWLRQGLEEDRLGMAITSCQIAQVGIMMMQYFKSVGQDFLEGPTEVKAANQAIAQIDGKVRSAMADAGIGPSTARQDQAETDLKLN